MFKYFFALSFLFVTLSTQAAPKCLALFERHSAIEILNKINEDVSEQLFSKAIDENIRQSSFVVRSYKLFKLKRMFRNLEKNGQTFDNYELASFVYKLEKLALAETIEANADYGKKLSAYERSVLAESRRSLVADGIIKHFGLDKERKGFLQKFGYGFSQAISWKYWRWASAWLVMPKLVGNALPPELAHKVLLEGLDAHRSEVEKYIPEIKGRDYFNKFSKVYNYAVVISLFTVVPYMTHSYYVEQMKIGQEQAQMILAPLAKTSQDMANVDQMMQKELGALDKYIEAYHLKYSKMPTEEQIEQVRQVIHQRIQVEFSGPSADLN